LHVRRAAVQVNCTCAARRRPRKAIRRVGEVQVVVVNSLGGRLESDFVVTAGVNGHVSDEVLACRLRDDPEVFGEVYDCYFRAIYRYVAGRLGTSAAEDVAAETFAVAFAQRDRFNPERGALRPWLFGIATNLIAGHRRGEARHYRALGRLPAPPSTGGHEERVVAAVAALRLRPQLLQALASLSRGERDVVLLVALGQLTHDEVAQALGISPGTVGSRLSRARNRLQHLINQEAL
jgi:RNA polymerase sigma-70 factor (ECF subfamily)